jgi:hypothetical protein
MPLAQEIARLAKPASSSQIQGQAPAQPALRTLMLRPAAIPERTALVIWATRVPMESNATLAVQARGRMRLALQVAPHVPCFQRRPREARHWKIVIAFWAIWVQQQVANAKLARSGSSDKKTLAERLYAVTVRLGLRPAPPPSNSQIAPAYADSLANLMEPFALHARQPRSRILLESACAHAAWQILSHYLGRGRQKIANAPWDILAMCTVAIQCVSHVHQVSTRHPWGPRRALLVQQNRSRELQVQVWRPASAIEVTSTVPGLAARRANPDSTRMNQGILRVQCLKSRTWHAGSTAGRLPIRQSGKRERMRWTSLWMQ